MYNNKVKNYQKAFGYGVSIWNTPRRKRKV